MVERGVAAVVIALCVVALALGASSLSAPTGGERGTGEGSGPGIDDSPSGALNLSSEEGASPQLLPAGAVEALFALVVALIVAGAVGYRRGMVAGGLLFVGFIVSYLLLASLFAGTVPGGVSPTLNATALSEGGGTGGTEAVADAERSTNTRPSGLLFGVIGVVVLAALGLVVAASASDDRSVDVTPPDPDEDDAPAVGAAAGRAADRIASEDEADVSNAVYAAWHEMATAVEVRDPATATPGEFAAAAREAGVDPDAVDDLTAVFEAVRYGDESASDHADAARGALRRIERGGDDIDEDRDEARAEDEK
jgi:hypothetical protein